MGIIGWIVLGFLAGLIASVALATVTLARDAEISADTVTWGALFLGLYVVAHVVIALQEARLAASRRRSKSRAGCPTSTSRRELAARRTCRGEGS